jgi:hypothetical protein
MTDPSLPPIRMWLTAPLVYEIVVNWGAQYLLARGSLGEFVPGFPEAGLR